MERPFPLCLDDIKPKQDPRNHIGLFAELNNKSMTPKEKAQSLYKKFDNNYNTVDQIIEAAIICVDEIIAVLGMAPPVEYWKQVRDELNN